MITKTTAVSKLVLVGLVLLAAIGSAQQQNYMQCGARYYVCLETADANFSQCMADNNNEGSALDDWYFCWDRYQADRAFCQRCHCCDNSFGPCEPESETINPFCT